MGMKTKAKVEEATLIDHRKAARRLGVTTKTFRNYVMRGTFPKPHTEVNRTWFYLASDIEYRIARREWPAGSEFMRARHASA